MSRCQLCQEVLVDKLYPVVVSIDDYPFSMTKHICKGCVKGVAKTIKDNEELAVFDG